MAHSGPTGLPILLMLSSPVTSTLHPSSQCHAATLMRQSHCALTPSPHCCHCLTTLHCPCCTSLPPALMPWPPPGSPFALAAVGQFCPCQLLINHAAPPVACQPCDPNDCKASYQPPASRLLAACQSLSFGALPATSCPSTLQPLYLSNHMPCSSLLPDCPTCALCRHLQPCQCHH